MAAHCEEILHSTLPGVPDACGHADEPPMGVDLNKYVPTSVLETREGGAAAAVAAAQDEGVPVPAQVAAGTDQVPCDGDGTSGFRVQAIYMVTAEQAEPLRRAQRRHQAVGGRSEHRVQPVRGQDRRRPQRAVRDRAQRRRHLLADRPERHRPGRVVRRLQLVDHRDCRTSATPTRRAST